MAALDRGPGRPGTQVDKGAQTATICGISPERGFKIVKSMGFVQYLKDTRGELRHVAWPTRTQTAIFTALVIILSVAVSFYLGLFDYLFTNGLRLGLDALPSKSSLQVQQQPLDLNQISTSTAEGGALDIPKK